MDSHFPAENRRIPYGSRKRISFHKTTAIKVIKSAIPVRIIAFSIFRFTGRRKIISIKINKSRPPSSAGIGIRFITPRLAENITVRLKKIHDYGYKAIGKILFHRLIDNSNNPDRSRDVVSAHPARGH